MFKYLFYRIYRFQNQVFEEDKSTAAFSAFLSVAIFWDVNLFSIFIIIDANIDLLTLLDSLIYNSKITVPSIVFLVNGFICYYYFYYESKYDGIIDEIESRNPSISRKYNWWAISYQIVSILFLIYAIIYRFN